MCFISILITILVTSLGTTDTDTKSNDRYQLPICLLMHRYYIIYYKLYTI